jgi:threonine/homoserine/homoserine lactone efflux protein
MLPQHQDCPMPPLPTLPLFLTAAVLLAITPGPGIFYVVARTVAGGRNEGIASAAGNSVGGLFHVCAGALGVSALVMASAEAFTLLKLVGAAYLVWLGIRTWREADAPLPATEDAGSGHAFRDGVLVEAFNPKTAAFFLAFIPQFIDPAHGVALQFVLLGLVSVTLNTLADVAAVLAAWRARAVFVRNPSLMRRSRKFSAAVLCGLGASLALARHGR